MEYGVGAQSRASYSPTVPWKGAAWEGSLDEAAVTGFVQMYLRLLGSLSGENGVSISTARPGRRSLFSREVPVSQELFHCGGRDGWKSTPWCIGHTAYSVYLNSLLNPMSKHLRKKSRLSKTKQRAWNTIVGKQKTMTTTLICLILEPALLPLCSLSPMCPPRALGARRNESGVGHSQALESWGTTVCRYIYSNPI